MSTAVPEIHADYVAHTLSFPPEDESDSDGDVHHEAGHVVIHIKEEGDYGFAVPTNVEFHIVTEAPKAFEWMGIFEVSDSSHTWSMQAVAGDDGALSYADPSMRVVLFPADTVTEEALHTLEAAADALMERLLHSGRGWRAMASIATDGSWRCT